VQPLLRVISPVRGSWKLHWCLQPIESESRATLPLRFMEEQQTIRSEHRPFRLLRLPMPLGFVLSVLLVWWSWYVWRLVFWTVDRVARALVWVYSRAREAVAAHRRSEARSHRCSCPLPFPRADRHCSKRHTVRGRRLRTFRFMFGLAPSRAPLCESQFFLVLQSNSRAAWRLGNTIAGILPPGEGSRPSSRCHKFSCSSLRVTTTHLLSVC
jgi:hypothetical protein